MSATGTPRTSPYGLWFTIPQSHFSLMHGAVSVLLCTRASAVETTIPAMASKTIGYRNEFLPRTHQDCQGKRIYNSLTQLAVACLSHECATC